MDEIKLHIFGVDTFSEAVTWLMENQYKFDIDNEYSGQCFNFVLFDKDAAMAFKLKFDAMDGFSVDSAYEKQMRIMAKAMEMQEQNASIVEIGNMIRQERNK